MNQTVLGAVIGVGGSTVAQVVAGLVSRGRDKQQLNEVRLRELAQIVDLADIALTSGQHALQAAGEIAQGIGVRTGHRPEPDSAASRDRLIQVGNDLSTYSSRLRLRVADDHDLMISFERASGALEQAGAAVHELLEPFTDTHDRPADWAKLQGARTTAEKAQRDFQAAARALLAPRLERLRGSR